MRTRSFEPQLRAGSGEPLLLIHGSGVSWTIWREVVPLLSDHFDVLAPTLGGHGGGAPLPGRPGHRRHLRGLGRSRHGDRRLGHRAHRRQLTRRVDGDGAGAPGAGAQRGRVLTGRRLTDDPRAMRRIRRFFTSARRQVRLIRPLARIAMRFSLVRKLAFRATAVHGDRVSTQHALELLDLVLAYDPRMIQILDTPARPIPDPGIPGLIAWCEKDRLIPMPVFSEPWREAAPWAEFRVVPGVGHSIMYDDPQLVASTIREWVHQSGATFNQGVVTNPETGLACAPWSPTPQVRPARRCSRRRSARTSSAPSRRTATARRWSRSPPAGAGPTPSSTPTSTRSPAG